MAQHWLATGRDHSIAGDLVTSALDVVAAQECHAAITLWRTARPALRRLSREHTHLGVAPASAASSLSIRPRSPMVAAKFTLARYFTRALQIAILRHMHFLPKPHARKLSLC